MNATLHFQRGPVIALLPLEPPLAGMERAVAAR